MYTSTNMINIQVCFWFLENINTRVKVNILFLISKGLLFIHDVSVVEHKHCCKDDSLEIRPQRLEISFPSVRAVTVIKE